MEATVKQNIIKAIPFALIILGMTGCGSGGDASNSTNASSVPSNLAGSYTITYSEPRLPRVVAAGFPGTSRTITAVDDSVARTVQFHLILESVGSGSYTGTYSDDSGISESVHGTSRLIEIEFSSSKSALDDRLHRSGVIQLMNPTLNDQKELQGNLTVKFDDYVNDALSRKMDSSGDMSCRRNAHDDSSGSTSNLSSPGSATMSDDEARIPGLWKAISKEENPYSGERFTLLPDKTVSSGGSVILNSSWKFTAGEPEKLDIIIPGSRTYRLTDLKHRGTIATGMVVLKEGEVETSHPVVLSKL